MIQPTNIIQIFTVLLMCVCFVLYNFITYIGLCIQHYNQDKEQFIPEWTGEGENKKINKQTNKMLKHNFKKETEQSITIRIPQVALL